MNRHHVVTRLIAAASAFAVTVWLLGSVVSLAEPQRGILIAKLQRDAAPAKTVLATATSRPTELATAPRASALRPL